MKKEKKQKIEEEELIFVIRFCVFVCASECIEMPKQMETDKNVMKRK